jgi:hypothetical protein
MAPVGAGCTAYSGPRPCLILDAPVKVALAAWYDADITEAFKSGAQGGGRG